LDGISLYAIRHEIGRYLPLRVQKIYHPSEKELLFYLWSNKFKSHLVLSLEKGRPFVGVADDKPETPRVPSGVCLGLRKRLEGGILQRIRQEGLDRILYFDFSGHDDFGNISDYNLVFDAAGGSGGFGLMLNGVVELSIPRARQRLEPGNPYVPPESPKHNLLSVQNPAWLADKICSTGKPAYMSLISHVEGLGKDLAISLLAKTGLPNRQPLGPENAENLAETLMETRDLLLYKRFCPALYIRRSGEPLLGVLPLHHLEPVKTYGSLLEGVSAYRAYLLHYTSYTALQSQARSMHKKLAAKVTARFDAQKQDLEKAKEYEKYRIWGELIHSSGRELPRGHNEIKVLDYYQDPPVETCVPLDPRFTSNENARRYYAKYAKLQRANKILRSSLEKAESYIARLDSIQERLNRDDDISSLLSVQDELVEIAGKCNIRIPQRKQKALSPVSRGKKVSRKPTGETVQVMDGLDGTVLYVGKNAAGNDYLVRHLRKPGDIWLHAKGVKGAHVLLRPAPGATVTSRALDWAAGLAARHSEAATSGKVEVDWIDAAAIKKPGGSPPGFVTYRGAKTIIVKAR